MIVQKFYDYAAFKQYEASEQHKTRQQFEQTLLAQHRDKQAFKLGGVCKACDAHSMFLIDKAFGGQETDQGWQPNWRERILCRCQLNNRQRAVLHSIKDSVHQRQQNNDLSIHIYATEQATSTFQWLVDYFKSYQEVSCIGSEYLGDNIAGGTLQDGLIKDIRHEDVENLSFADQSIDIIMSNDVLEHVNQPRNALQQLYRILRPKGELFLSIPFYPHAQTSVRRAEIVDGQLQHFLEPQYHGNPISDQGSLVFNDFGWDFLQQMRDIGFSEVCLCHYWSELHGYLGDPQYYLWAYKSD